MSELSAFARAAFPTRGSLSLIGYAVPLLWHILIGHDLTGYTLESKAASYAGLIAVFLLAALAFSARPRWSPGRGWTAAAAAAMCALPLWTCLPLESDAALALLTFVGEAGCAWMMVAWLSMYARLPLWVGATYTCLSYAASSAAELLLSPAFFDAALPALVIAVSLLGPHALGVARKCVDARGWERDDPDSSMESMGTTPMRALVITLVEIVACGFVLSALQGFGADVRRADAAANVLASLLKAIFPLLLLMPALGRDRTGGEAPLAQATLLAMAVLLAALALLGERYALVAGILIMVGRSIVQVFSVLVIVEIARNARRLAPEATIGLGRGAYTLAMLGGVVSSQMLGAFDENAPLALNTLFFILACIAMALSYAVSRTAYVGARPRSRADRLAGHEGAPSPGDAPSGGTAPGDAASRSALASLAGERGLTEREAQVIELLAKGNGVARIADILAVSENTVRFHCKNIYSKLGVHSKQELIDLVNRR